jgi:hypothetical protein
MSPFLPGLSWGVDQAAALDFLAEHFGVDQDDFEYEWDNGADHTFFQHSTRKRHSVHTPAAEHDEPLVTSSD